MATMFDDVMNYFRCRKSLLDAYSGMRDVAMGCLYISFFLEVEKGRNSGKKLGRTRLSPVCKCTWVAPLSIRLTCRLCHEMV
jgi:hypothetical protein